MLSRRGPWRLDYHIYCSHAHVRMEFLIVMKVYYLDVIIKLISLSRLIALELLNTHKVMSKTHKVHINKVGYVYERKQQVNKSCVY